MLSLSYDNDDYSENDDDEQTQGKSRNRRNLAIIFIVSLRTLGPTVAPGLDFNDDDDDDVADY